MGQFELGGGGVWREILFIHLCMYDHVLVPDGQHCTDLGIPQISSSFKGFKIFRRFTFSY